VLAETMGNGRTARIPRETHKPTLVVAEFAQIAPKRLRVHRLQIRGSFRSDNQTSTSGKGFRSGSNAPSD
jgi:hypothetical protein